MSRLFTSVRCLECDKEQGASLFPGNCPSCGSAWLEAVYDVRGLPENWPELVAHRPTDLWRYRELLPFPPGLKPISMGEGWTPLMPAEGLATDLGHCSLWIKDERQAPTGSFKDRQAACAVSALKAEGVQELVLASTGNAAAAYAAYCARAGIKLWVFLTSSVPVEKMRELALYGAEVVKVTGSYDQAKQIAADFASRRGIHYDGGAKAIPDKESMKTVAFEIVEQLGWQAPDWYVQAVSGGLGPLGVLKGFRELRHAGLIDKIPKLGIVQVAGCAPMVRAWERGLETAEPVVPDTLITVLATGDPGLAYHLLKQATDEHGGAMLAVSDGEAFRAMRRVARVEGMSVEPAASVAFAGLEKLMARGLIQAEERVVVNCSGHTFSAEKHALEDRYVVELKFDLPVGQARTPEGLEAALRQLDEQVTTVVVIDDNPHDSRLLRRLLERYRRYRVFEAHSGAEGVDLVRQRLPGLVVLDLKLPDIDGFAVLEELKRDGRTAGLPVMIVSGIDLTPEQLAYLEAQADSVWQKGRFSSRELVQHLVAALGEEGAIAAHASPDLPAQAIQFDSLTQRFGGGQCPSILVVDDNVWDARLMRRLLEAKGRFRVVEAHSAREALNALEERTPDLVLLDLVLPDRDGAELLEAMRSRQETRQVPVVVVSAKDLDPSMRARLTSSADSIWSKGMLDRNSLLAHLESILAK